MDTSSELPPALDRRLLSRRTLVRAGATAAWSVPLVQVVSAAPAAATGSGSSNLTSTVATAAYGSATTLRVTGTTSYTGVTPTSFQMTVVLPAGVTASDAVVTSGNWVKPQTVSGGSVVFTATGTPPGGSFDITLTVSASTAGTLSVTPAATNQGTVTSGSAPVSGFVAQTKSTLAWSGYTAAWQNGGKNLRVAGTITNSGNVATTGLKVTVTLPSGNQATSVTINGTSGNGWSRVGTGSSQTYTFTNSSQIAVGGTRAVDLVFAMTGFSGGGVSSVAHADNATTTDVTAAATVDPLTASVIKVVGESDTNPPVIPSPVNNTGDKLYTVKLRVQNPGPRYVVDPIVTLTTSKSVSTDSTKAPAVGGTGWSVLSVSADGLTTKFKYTGTLDYVTTATFTPTATITFNTKGNTAGSTTFSVTGTNAA